MGWGKGSSPAARKRRRYTVAAMGIAGLLATAVGATGVHSFAETLTEQGETLMRHVPFFAPAEPVQVAAVIKPAAPAEPASPATSSQSVFPSVSGASSHFVLPPTGSVGTISHSSIRPATLAKPAVVAKAPAPAALPLPPVRSLASANKSVPTNTFASTSDAWFGDDQASGTPSNRALADRGGRAIAIVDAGPAPTLDFDSIVDVSEPAEVPTSATRGPRVVSVTGAGLPGTTPGRVLDPAPVVAPPLEQVVDLGELGTNTGPAPGSEIPPAEPTVDLPYDVIVDGGLLPPRHATDPGWTPGTGPVQDVIVMPDGSIIVVPEPTTLLAVALPAAALLGRRRRRG